MSTLNFLGRLVRKLWAIENQDALETAQAQLEFWRARAELLELERDQWKYNANRLMEDVLSSGLYEQIMAHSRTRNRFRVGPWN